MSWGLYWALGALRREDIRWVRGLVKNGSKQEGRPRRGTAFLFKNHTPSDKRCRPARRLQRAQNCAACHPGTGCRPCRGTARLLLRAVCRHHRRTVLPATLAGAIHPSQPDAPFPGRKRLVRQAKTGSGEHRLPEICRAYRAGPRPQTSAAARR